MLFTLFGVVYHHGGVYPHGGLFTSGVYPPHRPSHLPSRSAGEDASHPHESRRLLAPGGCLPSWGVFTLPVAPLTSPRGPQARTRAIHTSPAVFSLARVMQGFRARSQLLVSRLEDDDNVRQRGFSDEDHKDEEEEEEEDER